MDVPWVARAPTEIVHSNERLTTQPYDAPPTTETFRQMMDHMASDEMMLLVSTDYPHWQCDDEERGGPAGRLVARPHPQDHARQSPETYPRQMTT